MRSDSPQGDFPILLVEDDDASRLLMRRMLLQAGHEVSVVADGRQALELMAQRYFPIVLTDWVMPEMDGLQLCRAIREREEGDYVFIILITSRNSAEDVIEGLEAGADDYIKKPFDRGELAARLKSGRRVIELANSLKRANEEITRRSLTDPLTGVFNRSYLDGNLDEEVEHAASLRVPVSVVLCDIDRFKQVNDTYGHRAGDAVLEEFAERVRQSIRQGGDWVARFGGEEFLIVLPNTDPESALAVAERIRSTVSRHITQVGSDSIPITASFGVAGWVPGEDGDTVAADALIELADRYLYQAKKAGRNCVRGQAPMVEQCGERVYSD